MKENTAIPNLIQFATIESKRIEVEHQVVDPSKATLVFLHEGLGCLSMWRDFPEKVATATNCNLLVYSRLGYGQSDPATLPRSVNYLHDEALLTLPAILARLNIGKHILIGHSDGGSIAIINGGGVCSPDLVGIITLAAHVFAEAIGIQAIEEARVAYQTTEMREKLANYHADADHTFWGWNGIWLDPEFLHWNIEAYLPTITVPMLVIQGLEDQYGTLAQVEAIVNGVSSSRIEKCLLPECEHAPQRDQPEAVLAAMTAFIQETITGL